jgi:hypothetical protein
LRTIHFDELYERGVSSGTARGKEEEDEPDEGVELIWRRKLDEKGAILLLDVESEDLVLFVVEAVAGYSITPRRGESAQRRERREGKREGRTVEAEVALVKRTRDVEVPVGVVSDDAVLEDEGTLVRTHLLRCEVAFPGDVENRQTRVLSVANGARCGVLLGRLEVVDSGKLDEAPLGAGRRDLSVGEALLVELLGPVRWALLPALGNKLRVEAAFVLSRRKGVSTGWWWREGDRT